MKTQWFTQKQRPGKHVKASIKRCICKNQAELIKRESEREREREREKSWCVCYNSSWLHDCGSSWFSAAKGLKGSEEDPSAYWGDKRDGGGMLHQLGFPAIICCTKKWLCKTLQKFLPFPFFLNFLSSLCHMSLYVHPNKPLQKHWQFCFCFLSRMRLKKLNTMTLKEFYRGWGSETLPCCFIYLVFFFILAFALL